MADKQYTVEDFANWLGELERFAGGEGIEIVEITPGGMKIRIYTSINSYSISARNPTLRDYPISESASGSPVIEPGTPTEKRMDNGYLGCVSTCRKPRAGEDWHRGSDLADGPLVPETWHRILADIVSYEMVKVHIKHEPILDGEPPVGVAA